MGKFYVGFGVGVAIGVLLGARTAMSGVSSREDHETRTWPVEYLSVAQLNEAMSTTARAAEARAEFIRRFGFVPLRPLFLNR